MVKKTYSLWTYPLWLNITSLFVFALIIIGFIWIIIDTTAIIGLIMMIVGFLGLGIFGKIAEKIGKPIKK